MKSRGNLIAAAIALVLGAVYQFAPMFAPASESVYDARAFGTLPVSYAGRYKPIDTVARNALLSISGRQHLKEDDTKVDASAWLLELAARPDLAVHRKAFRIDDPDVLAVLGLSHAQAKRFSFSDIVAKGDELQKQYTQASQVESADRNAFQRNIMHLGDQLGLFQDLMALSTLGVVPPAPGEQGWSSMHAHGKAMSAQQQEIASHYQSMLESYAAGDAAGFNAEVATLKAALQSAEPKYTTRATEEELLNRVNPFGRALVLYVVAGVLLMVSWLRWQRPLFSAAVALVLFAWTVHTIGLAARIYLSGRPPVTNLYSSALFIGWGAVLVSVVLERFLRGGLGVFLAAVIGFLTLLIAQGLTGSGDTMAVLQAVLDTNFWLATHVVVITLGYSATYLAGFLGIAYVIRGVFTRTLDAESSRRLVQMIYGVVCFATLLSFLGTILGGIWADQSWGRFWGWDPKENGALIIVLWNALILHARWGGIARQRGIAVLAIFGNIVTSWSWFGVNMLGRGLHSYGFIDSVAFWLVAFVLLQLVLVVIGSMPQRLWRSGKPGQIVRKKDTDPTPAGARPNLT
ncbi:MAG: cytochrome c biogenesis protein CcsA [Phycisphaerales bacterium]